MANDQAGNPWYFDSVMATPYPYWVKIENMVWERPAALNDVLQVKDRNGRFIVDEVAAGADVTKNLFKTGWVNGFQVTAIGSGKLLVVISK